MATLTHQPTDFDARSTDENPAASFQSLAAEGDILAKQGDYKKAAEAYSKALELKPTDKFVLVARSRCYLSLGDHRSALDDAESALREDKEFFKAKFQKAEALYAMGDFEMALVYYHRGHVLRPELDEFRLGIQKAREAIDNSIGNPRDYNPHKEHKEHKRPVTAENKTTAPSARAKTPVKNEKTVKQLLGELYEDKAYLEQFLNDHDLANNPNENVRQLIVDGLKFLESRTDFWRQQKPIYARKKEQHRVKRRPESPKKEEEVKEDQKPAVKKLVFKNAEEADKWASEQLKLVQKAIDTHQHEKGLRLSKNLLTLLKDKTGENQKPLSLINDKDDIAQGLYAKIAGLFFELGSLREAEHWNKKDLAVAKHRNNSDAKSRALGNLGRIYVKERKFDEALKVWKEKIELAESGFATRNAQEKARAAVEITWLHHDTAKCQFILQSDASASVSKAAEWLKIASESLADSQDAMPEVNRWTVQVALLQGQLATTTGQKEQAKTHYASALESAKSFQDTAGAAAAEKALLSLQ